MLNTVFRMFRSDSDPEEGGARGPAAAAKRGELLAKSTSAAASVIGKEVVVRDHRGGAEDIVIQGRVEGKIDMAHDTVTVHEHGEVSAGIVARSVVITGKVLGDVIVSEHAELLKICSVRRDVRAPWVAMATGAHVGGCIVMRGRWNGKPVSVLTAG